jgi:hypothetical protein
MTAFLAWLKNAIPLIVILLFAFFAFGTFYQLGRASANSEWQQKWAAHQIQDATRRGDAALALAQAFDAARKKEQQYTAAQAKVIQDARHEQTIQQKNAAAAATATRRLRLEAARLATRATQLSANSADTTARQRRANQQYTQTTRVLSNLLASCADRRRSLAQYTDQIAITARACENTWRAIAGE